MFLSFFWGKEMRGIVFLAFIAVGNLQTTISNADKTIDEQICEAFSSQEAEMAKRLPYQVSEFWFNTQFYVSCPQKMLMVVKKHTVLNKDEFETTVAEDFQSQMANSPTCNNVIFQDDLGWTINTTLQDVNGEYVTNARITYEICKKKN